MRTFSSYFALATLLGFLALLSACDSGSSNKGSDSISSSSSSSSSSGSSSSSSSSGVIIEGNVRVHFPPRYSRVDDDTITLRGVVIDTEGVNQVLVNGEPVDTANGFANWSYTTSLQPGANELVISEETAEGITEVDHIVVERTTNITTPTSVVDDHSNNRLLILDTARNTIIAADKDSGALFTLSPAAGEPNQITKPRGLALDEARNRLLVYQGRASIKETHAEFLAVDLTTGAQSVFAAPDFTDIFLEHSPMSVITVGDVAYVADRQFEFVDAEGNAVSEDAENVAFVFSAGMVYRIDLTNGTRTVVSSRTLPEPGENEQVENPLRQVRSLAYDTINTTLYALDTSSTNITDSPRLFAIDTTTGKRTLMALTDADKKAFSLRRPQMLDIDTARQQLFLLNDATTQTTTDPTIVKIDIATKVAADLSSNTIPKDGDFVLSKINAITYSANDDEIYLLEDAQDAVLRVNTTSGVRSLVAATGPVDTKNYLGNHTLHDVFFRDDRQTYLLDRKFSSVFGYNLYFGDKVILNNSVTNDLEQDKEILRTPSQGAWDPINQVMLLINNADRALVTFDPETKIATRHINNIGAAPVDMVIDIEAGVAYSAFAAGIMQTDLQNNYQSELLSTNALPDSASQFGSIQGIALDADNNRLLAADSRLNAIVAVDTTSGARSYFSPPSPTPDAEDVLTLPRAIAIDKPGNRALILDTGRKAILAADLATGERSMVYEYAEPTPRQLFTPTEMVMHPSFHYLLLLDSTTNQLVALDLTTETPQLVYLTR